MRRAPLERWSPPRLLWPNKTKANTVAGGRILAKDRADAKPATTGAKEKILAKAKVAARPLRTLAKERMVAPRVGKSMNNLVARFLVSLSLSVLAVGCLFINMGEAEDSSSSSTVKVRLIGQNGLLTEPVTVPKVKKTDAEWRKQLTPEQFEIARGEGTEPAFCGTLLDNHREGIYHCVCCGLPLFSSGSKFNSGTGWPSFFQPVAKENVRTRTDNSFGMRRTEILCARCGAHLGHVFDDGPPPTGLRFCLNSAAMTFVDKGKEVPEVTSSVKAK
jgi:peptide-methionine (R)-S-oxide reductase